MKYYYKSPEELREMHENRKTQKKGRNRGRTIMILDVAILLILAGIMYYKGFFTLTNTASQHTVQLEHTEFSGSLPGIKKDQGIVEMYLNVKNNGTTSLKFPADKGPYSLKKAMVEFQSKGLILHSTPVVLDILEITPGLTANYPLHAHFPLEKRGQFKKFSLTLRLQLEGRSLIITFPEVVTK